MKKLLLGAAILIAVAMPGGTASATTVTLKMMDGTPGPIVLPGPGVATVGVWADSIPDFAGFQLKFALDKLTGPGTGAWSGVPTSPLVPPEYWWDPDPYGPPVCSAGPGWIVVIRPDPGIWIDPPPYIIWPEPDWSGTNLLPATFRVRIDSGTLFAGIDTSTGDSFIVTPVGAALPVTWSGPIQISVVPEPATLSLFGVGLLGLLRLRGKRGCV